MRGSDKGRKRSDRLPVPEVALLAVAALILAAIVGGTVWAFATGRANPGRDSARRSDREAAAGVEGMYRDLGTLRSPTADSAPSVVVVAPVFAYDPADVAFREELAAKKAILRSAVSSWFLGKTRSELDRLGEAGVKDSLLETLNATLDAGTLSRLYFLEYAVVD